MQVFEKENWLYMRCTSSHFTQGFFGAVILAGWLSSGSVEAQSDLSPVPEKPGGDLSPVPEYPMGSPVRPEIVLPPVKQEADAPLSAQVNIAVRHIQLSGGTIFSSGQLTQITAPYEGREITTDDLQRLRRELTLYYVNHGYINSGAVIPDQKVADGVVRIDLVEGSLVEIKVKGNTSLRDSYIRNRLVLHDGKPLHLPTLQEQIALLHQDRLIKRIDAHLVPGLRRGEAILEVTVEEQKPYAFGFSFNNRRSPSVGELRGEIWGSYLSVFGYGDAVTFRYGMTEGLNDVGVDYSLPLSGRGTRLGTSVSRSDSAIIEKPFDSIDISSETENVGIELSHPFWQRLDGYFRGSVRLDRRYSKTVFLQDEPYPSPGSENGKSTVAVLRLGQEWLSRRRARVLALRSRFSFGVDAFGATINRGDVPDGRFTAWLGQFQWVQRLSEKGSQLVARTDLQLANKSLLPLEQFGIGGASSVRGYRENLLVRDSGWVGSLEIRVPVAGRKLQVAAFYDVGGGKNVTGPSPKLRDISSVGLGVRWSPARYVYGQLYWGYALKDVDVDKDKSLQDSGFHFRLDVQI